MTKFPYIVPNPYTMLYKQAVSKDENEKQKEKKR